MGQVFSVPRWDSSFVSHGGTGLGYRELKIVEDRNVVSHGGTGI